MVKNCPLRYQFFAVESRRAPRGGYDGTAAATGGGCCLLWAQMARCRAICAMLVVRRRAYGAAAGELARRGCGEGAGNG